MAQEFSDPNIGRICIRLLGMPRPPQRLLRRRLLYVFYGLLKSGVFKDKRRKKTCYLGNRGNIPFNQTRHPFFKAFVHELSGAVKHIATEAMLRGLLLNAVYDEAGNTLMQQLEEEEYTVLHV